MTNGEYLRSLSDDELGKRLCDLFGDCKMCFASEQCSVGHNGMVAWANEESDILPFDKQNSQMTCKDCVSRQSAIKRIDEALARVFKEPCGELILRKLPSVQPEIIRCKDCKHRDVEDGFCEGRGWPMQLVPDDGFCDKGERSEE